MEQAKAILKRIFFLPPLPTLCIALPSFALVIYVLDQGFLGPLAYAVYVLSAYALVISITGGPGIIAGFVQWIRAHPLTRKMLRIPLVKRFAEDVRFRTSVSLYQGLIVNLLYIAIKLSFGFYYRSWWFLTLAVYYILLAVLRVLLLWRWGGIGAKQELRRYHSRRVKSRVFQEGDLVLRLIQDQTDAHKLSPPWEGPLWSARTCTTGHTTLSMFGSTKIHVSRRKRPIGRGT